MVTPLRVHSEGEPSFESIYRKHFKMVYKVCFSYMKNEHDTEDITAEVFIKLLKNGTSFETAEHEKAWILRTAINVCKDNLKHWWQKRENIDDYEHLTSENPFKTDETLKLVLDLPPKYKDVIYLYYYEGYSTLEVSEILQKPHSTIRRLMREARNLLRGAIENEK